MNEVIPIASNIPKGQPAARVLRSVCYFGLIMPGKGLEHFVELMRLLKGQGFVFTLIGSSPEMAVAYSTHITSQVLALGGEVIVDASAEVVANNLQMHSYAYLPFPDGVTDKRGSLLAALVNGVKILAPLSSRSRPPLMDYVVHVANPQDAAKWLLNLAEERDSRPSDQPHDLERYTWRSVVQRHLRLYNTVLSQNDTPRSWNSKR